MFEFSLLVWFWELSMRVFFLFYNFWIIEFEKVFRDV